MTTDIKIPNKIPDDATKVDYTVEDKVNRLMKKAINRGGTDNISIAYLQRFDESGEE